MASFYEAITAADLTSGLRSVAHNLNAPAPAVAVYDHLGNMLRTGDGLLESVRAVDANTVAVQFTSIAFEFLPPETTYGIRIVT